MAWTATSCDAQNARVDAARIDALLAAVMDDLKKYTALPVEANLDLDVLAWWKARDHNKPADPASGRPAGLPHLAKMAAQFLGRPATSAGVERMFSKAGKLHDDMKKGQQDEAREDKKEKRDSAKETQAQKHEPKQLQKTDAAKEAKTEAMEVETWAAAVQKAAPPAGLMVATASTPRFRRQVWLHP